LLRPVEIMCGRTAMPQIEYNALIIFLWRPAQPSRVSRPWELGMNYYNLKDCGKAKLKWQMPAEHMDEIWASRQVLTAGRGGRNCG